MSLREPLTPVGRDSQGMVIEASDDSDANETKETDNFLTRQRSNNNQFIHSSHVASNNKWNSNNKNTINNKNNNNNTIRLSTQYHASDNMIGRINDLNRWPKNQVTYLGSKIVIFLYFLFSCLLLNYFPHMPSWFGILMFINLVACILGLLGIYLTRSILIKICWIVLVVVLGLNVLAVIIYLFSDDLSDEASDRCTTLQTEFTISNCKSKVKEQLTWQIIGLTFIYVLISLLGVNVIVKSEIVTKEIETQSNDKPTISRHASSIDSDASFDENAKQKRE